MDLKLRYAYVFERGMNEGAQAQALDIKRTAKHVATLCGFHAAKENKAFCEGFELGRGYVTQWRESADLLRCAIEIGDVTPKDFKDCYCRNAGNMFFEEI